MEKLKEYHPFNNYFPENFEVVWENDHQVTIDIMMENVYGEVDVVDTIEIELES